ncbi:MAG: CidA/LrgA family protein [Thalassolituus sp.]
MTGLLILLFFLVAGSLLQSEYALPVPGSIIGMLLLLVFLLIRGRTPESLSQVSKTLSPLLPLFIIPVSVGIVTQKELLAENGVALLVILAVSIIPGALVCAAIMQAGRRGGDS